MGGPEWGESEIKSLIVELDATETKWETLENMDLDQVWKEVDRLLEALWDDYLKSWDEAELGKTA